MAQDRKPGQPAWKAAAGASKASAGGPQYAWKPPDQAGKSPWGRRAKLGGVVLGGLGCVALIVVLIYWLRPQRGACLVLVGADPVADVVNLDAPLDVYGWHGGERLAGWSDAAAKTEHTSRSKLTPQLVTDGITTPESVRPADLPSFLQKLEKRELNPLILYLGLHGGADAAGPFLFTANGERLYLRELIEGFAGPRLKDKQVVLLIDSARLTPDPALGVLHPDCVRALKALDDEKLFDKVPNLVVICGSDAGERGWSAEEWGTTGFAEMLLRGLSGAAAPSQGAVINAADLFSYVREQTYNWSQATRPTA
ncbi:MAG TPA: hypothetical protein VH120_12770, partial [Gemmataceae bacterium]|nr:hypothetical protein [Gemmataceae bacterium]